VVGRSSEPGRQSLSRHLLYAALPAASEFDSPRGWALALLGINEYLRAFQGESSVEALQRCRRRLLARFRPRAAATGPGARTVTYDTARLPQALIVSGSRMGNQR
jgi:hypothetical protein